jgi:hypothetical protein
VLRDGNLSQQSGGNFWKGDFAVDDSVKLPVPSASHVREIGDAPFCWQHKAALWRIREAFDESTFLDQSLAVYLTLCELASDEQSATFTATRRKIAERSGVSMRRVSEILARFKLLNLLNWKQNFLHGTKELAPSTFTLTSCTASTTPSCTPSTRSCTDVFSENCTVVKESKESPEKSPQKKSAALLFEALIPKRLNKPEFLAVWKDWQDHRSKIRKPMNELMAKKELEKLSEWAAQQGLEKIIENVNAAIAAGSAWIYEPKAKFKKSDDDDLGY